MLDTGHPVYVRVVGDIELAAPYVGLAKQKTRALAATVTGIYGSEHGRLDADIRYHAVVNGNHWAVTIWTEGCPRGDYGAYSELLPTFSTVSGEWVFPDASTRQWATSYKLDADGNYILDSGGNRQVLSSAFFELRNKRSPLGHHANYMGTGFVGPENNLEAHVVSELVFLDKFKASKFSGTMRKVVQVLLGLGYKKLSNMGIASNSPDNPTFSFNYTFSETHGIYIAADGTWWVIRITSAGVYRRRAQWCVSKRRSDVRTFLGYYSDNRDDTGALLPEAQQWDRLDGNLSPVYTRYSPAFAACGWAFSPNGKYAQNVVFRTEPEVASGRPYVYGARWRIAIIESNGIPSSISLAKLEEGIIWNSDRVGLNVGHFQVPDDSVQGCITFDYNLGYLTTQRPTADPIGPMYVYYDDNGGEVVVRCRYDEHVVQTENTTETPTTSTYTNVDGLTAQPGTTGNLFLGTSANPRSITDGNIQTVRTAGTARSDSLSCTAWTPTLQTYFNGGTTDAYYELAWVEDIPKPGQAFITRFTLSGTKYNNPTSGVRSDFCGTSTPYSGNVVDVVGYIKSVMLVKHTVVVTAYSVVTDSTATVPYGERQAVIFASRVNTGGYTSTDTRLPYTGEKYDFHWKVTGMFAEGDSCATNNGSTDPQWSTGDPSSVHISPMFTLDGFDYDTGFWYSASVDSKSENANGAAGRAKYAGLISANNASGGSAEYMDTSTIAKSPDASEPAPKTRYSWTGVGGTPLTNPPLSTMTGSFVTTATANNQYSGAIVGADGTSRTLSSPGTWHVATFKAYSILSFLGVRASYDAFDSANKYMYSQTPGSYATVTYPGVAAYTSSGVFGFVGYEDTNEPS